MHKDTTAFCPPAHRFLCFKLGGLEYGLDFSKVQELRILKSLERFSSDGAIVQGVAVSRGVIMPTRSPPRPPRTSSSSNCRPA